MFFWVSASCKAVCALVDEAASVVEFTFDEGPVAWTEPIYIFPRSRSIERYLVWSRSYNGPVTFVQLQHCERLLAGEECVRVRQITPCCNAGTRKLVKRAANMEIDSTTEDHKCLRICMSSSFKFGGYTTHQKAQCQPELVQNIIFAAIIGRNRTEKREDCHLVFDRCGYQVPLYDGHGLI